jgi:hypothetical protein
MFARGLHVRTANNKLSGAAVIWYNYDVYTLTYFQPYSTVYILKYSSAEPVMHKSWTVKHSDQIVYN